MIIRAKYNNDYRGFVSSIYTENGKIYIVGQPKENAIAMIRERVGDESKIVYTVVSTNYEGNISNIMDSIKCIENNRDGKEIEEIEDDEDLILILDSDNIEQELFDIVDAKFTFPKENIISLQNKALYNDTKRIAGMYYNESRRRELAISKYVSNIDLLNELEVNKNLNSVERAIILDIVRIIN